MLRVLVLFNVCFFIHDFLYFFIRSSDKELGNYFNLLYNPLEYLLIYYFFRTIYQLPSSKKFLNISLFVFWTFWFASSLFVPIYLFNSYGNGVESIFVIILTLIYFFEELKKPQALFIYSQPQFWGVIGFFLFFAGSFFVFLYKQTHKQDQAFFEQYRYIHASFFILRSFLFSIAMFIKSEKITIPNERSSFT